ncbi:MAG: CRTAC1 family protein, partial [Acidobacteriota bacterium]
IQAVPQPTTPQELSRYLFILGQELLLAGESAEAALTFDKLLAMLDEHKGLPFTEDAVQGLRVSRALAYLRQGEQENCITQHNIDRCLLPIRGEGVHTEQQGSRAAIAAYSELLEKNPDDLGFRWLLNLAYMTVGEYPDKVPAKWRIPPQAFASDHDLGRFYDVAPQVGLDVFGLSGGSIMDDFDDDGLLDIVASGWGLTEQLRFFVNNGDGSFTERTEEAGLSGILGGLNIFQADYDNNGHLDILVLRGAWLQDSGRHPNSLLRNNGPDAKGQVTFTDVTERSGLLTFHPTKVGAWADYDNDGWLDLFVGNESTVSARHPAELFRNNGPDANGDVTFTDVAREAGVGLITYIKGAAWGDYDNDGLIDLYVANLSGGGPNFLYRNQGRQAGGGWKFADVTAQVGAEGPKNSFPTWFWDYDNDGWLDIFVSGYRANIESLASEYLGLGTRDAELPALLRNRGPGADGSVTFSDETKAAGLDTILLTMGGNFGDLDNDGYLDFYAGTGDTEYRTLMPNRMFRNDGGQRFQDVTTSGGFGHLQKGHGIAFGDIDNDGDQDIYAVMGGAHSGDGFQNALFENPGHGNRWISLRLEGTTANRAAIGARIRIEVETAAGTQRSIYATVGSGGSFGASSLRQEIGLGDALAITSIEVTWPGDREAQRFAALPMDRFYRLKQGEPKPQRLDLPSFELPRDAAVSHAHHGG